MYIDPICMAKVMLWDAAFRVAKLMRSRTLSASGQNGVRMAPQKLDGGNRTPPFY
jgi:hypothetical protein